MTYLTYNSKIINNNNNNNDNNNNDMILFSCLIDAI